MSIRVTIAALGAKIVLHIQHVTLQMTEVVVVIMSVFPQKQTSVPQCIVRDHSQQSSPASTQRVCLDYSA